jgi:hypothetical protein
LRWLRHRNQPKGKWLFGLTLSIATIIGTIITGIIGIIIAPIDKAFLQKAKNGPAAVSAAGPFY